MKLLRTAALAAVSAVALAAAPAMAVTTVSNNNAAALGAALAGQGIVFTSATLNTTTQNGTFSGGTAGVGFENGIVLTTGVLSCVGSSNTVANCGTNGNGAGSTLTLGFTASSTQLFFNYVFASEEYPEYVNGGVNDRFTLSLNGANYSNVNLARLDNGAVVSIDTVNASTNSAFYRSNSGATSLNLPIQYDGLTTVLTASATNLVVGQNYTLTFDIQDQGDTAYDSAVFIQGGSVGVVTPPPTGAVPEPTTWATMMLGLGAVGAAARRRRRAGAAIA